MWKAKAIPDDTHPKVGYHMYGCIMRTRHAVCGNRWVQWERIKVILYVQMRFVVRIRTRQTESVDVAIQNVFAHESDRTFQGVTLS